MKKILSMLIALALCVTLIPPASFATDTHSHPVCGTTCSHTGSEAHTSEEWTAWSYASALPSAAGNYYLTVDVTLADAWEVPLGTVNLCLNSHTVTGASDKNALNIADGATFNLTDCTDAQGKITHAAGEKGRGVYMTGGTFNMYGGIISENTVENNNYGGGVCVQGGNFTLSGTAKILGNTANNGGAVAVISLENGENSTFTVKGGNIGEKNDGAGNTAKYYGGGIYIMLKEGVTGTAEVTMEGGTLVGNSAVTSGGGVCIRGGTFNLSGGTISENSSANYGGGVSVYGGAFTMEGSASISKNTNTSKYGGGVYLDSGTFDMKGSASISENSLKDSGYGGGVYVLHGSFNLSGSASIEKNTAYMGGGVSVFGKTKKEDTVGGKFTMKSGNIIGNSATYGGAVSVHNTIDKTYSTFDMQGGTLGGNNAGKGNSTSGRGGALYIGDGKVTLQGGTISGNTASNGGGGVVVETETVLEMKGDASIVGNSSANGGGVLLFGTFDMQGGTICGNNADRYASGGVYMNIGDSETMTLSGAAQIKDNVKGGTRNAATGKYMGGTAGNLFIEEIWDNSGLKKVTVGGALIGGAASIGISTEKIPQSDNPLQFALGKSGSGAYTLTKSDKKAFFPDLGTQSRYISLNGDDNALLINYGPDPHIHNWTYALDTTDTLNDTVKATCNAEDCSNPSGSVKISAPKNLTYDTSEKAATLTLSDGWSAASVTSSDIVYKSAVETLASVPKNAGRYTASITVGDKTATVEYEILPKTVSAAVSVDAGQNLTYNGGAEIRPTVTVKDGSTTIDPDEYEIEYLNNTDAGAATVTVTDKAGGNYKVTGSTSFTIEKKTLTDDMVTVSADFKYDGNEKSPTVTVKNAGTTLAENTDYTLSNNKKTAADDYELTVNGKGNYQGEIKKNWSIGKANITEVSVNQKGTLTYNATEQTPAVETSASAKGGETVTFKYSLEESGAYATSLPKFKNVKDGGYTVYFKASAPNHNDYDGNFTVTLSPKEITVSSASAKNRNYEAGKTSVEIESVTFGGATLTKGTDYSATANAENENAGIGKRVTGTVELLGNATKNYTLSGASFETSVDIAKITYGGEKETTASAMYGNTGEKDLSAFIAPGGTAEYDNVDDTDKIFKASPTMTDAKLGFSLADNEEKAEKTAKVFVKVKNCTNYTDYTITVKVTSADKTEPEVTVQPITKVYTGAALTNGDITATSGGVAGTWSWKDGSSPKNTGDSTAKGKKWTVVFTPTDTNRYKKTEKEVSVTIQPKEITVTAGSYTVKKVYDKNKTAGTGEGTLAVSGIVSGDTVNVTPSPAAFDDENVGGQSSVKVNLSLNGEDKDNYVLDDASIFVPCEISKATPSVVAATAAVTYGNAPKGSDITANTGGVAGSFAWKNVTDYGNAGTKSFDASFTPNDTNNYNPVSNVTVAVTVNKASARTLSDITDTYKYSLAGEKTVQIGSIMPSDAGTLTYSKGTSSVVGESNVTFSVNASGLVTYTLTSCAPNDIITMPVIISSDNYEDSAVNVKITLTDKDSQAPLTLICDSSVIYGESLTLAAEGGSGTGSVRYEVIGGGTGEATVSANTLTATKAGKVKVKAIKEADTLYAAVESAPCEITVSKANPTGVPKYTKITSAGKTLADAGLTVTDADFSVAGSVKWVDENGIDLPDETVAERNTEYKWLFTPTDTVNYNTLTGAIELYHVASGGGGTSRYTVSFGTDGGTSVKSQTVSKDTRANEPKEPTRDGYIFGGWYTDKNFTKEFDFSEKITKSVKLYAKWIEKTDEKEDEPTAPEKPVSPDTPDTGKWANPFKDVKENDWFFDSVKFINENKLMSGTKESEFAPNLSLTRGMLVTVLYRMAGEPEVEKISPFEDVKDESYYKNAVIWAQQNGVVSGTGKNLFAPESNITREQIAVILYRYAKSAGKDVAAGENTNITAYTDSKDISEYAKEAVKYAVGSGLMNGKTKNTVNPKDFASRAEIAALLQRFFELNK